jgi:5-methyltetrahydrofolate corrinoid/iron sulfur protein methyltransferase
VTDRFIVIGENIHASRVLAVSGSRVARLADGSLGLPFEDEDGAAGILPVAAGAIVGTGDRARVKHVAAALWAGLEGGPVGELGRGYLRALARRQAAAGALFLDLNVDETSTSTERRAAAMTWLVGAVEDATDVPLSLDSSDAAVLRAGLASSTRRGGAPLLNSASVERLDVLHLAAAEACSVVLAASGSGGLPATAEARVANARPLVEAALGLGFAFDALHVDPLVLPVGVDPAAGAAYLGAVRTIRGDFGPALHVTGGLSNVSFGLPVRQLLNEVFIALAADAGADSAIVDPVANDPRRAFVADRTTRPWRLAADLLTGADPFGGAYLRAYRASELA